jgi:uncharacterized membrane protein YpjA
MMNKLGFQQFFDNKKFLLILILINVGAALFSIKYYLPQLMNTNPLLWVFVPDSIVATLIFAVALFLLYKKKLSESIAALAIMGMWKYGLWSLFVLFSAGNNFFDYWYFYLGHFLMIVETIVLYKKNKIVFYAFGPALLFFVANDILDYFFDLHPPFSQVFFSETMVIAFLLTILLPFLVVFVYSKDK